MGLRGSRRLPAADLAFGLAASAAATNAADAELAAMLEGVQQATKNPMVRDSLAAALRIVRRDEPGDPVQDFLERYAMAMPGRGDGDERCASLLAVHR